MDKLHANLQLAEVEGWKKKYSAAVKALEVERKQARAQQEEIARLKEKDQRHLILEKGIKEQLRLTEIQLRDECVKHQENLKLAKEELMAASKRMEEFNTPEMRKFMRIWKAMSGDNES